MRGHKALSLIGTLFDSPLHAEGEVIEEIISLQAGERRGWQTGLNHLAA